MKLVHLLPAAMILMSIGAATAYAFDGDWRRALYWSAAAVITVSVTL